MTICSCRNSCSYKRVTLMLINIKIKRMITSVIDVLKLLPRSTMEPVDTSIWLYVSVESINVFPVNNVMDDCNATTSLESVTIAALMVVASCIIIVLYLMDSSWQELITVILYSFEDKFRMTGSELSVPYNATAKPSMEDAISVTVSADAPAKKN